MVEFDIEYDRDDIDKTNPKLRASWYVNDGYGHHSSESAYVDLINEYIPYNKHAWEIIPIFTIEDNLLEEKQYLLVSWRTKGDNKHGIKIALDQLNKCQCQHEIELLKKELESLRNEVRRDRMDDSFAGHEPFG